MRKSLPGLGEVEHTEVRSEKARNVILSYNEKIYYVNRVTAKVEEGTSRVKAVFHAKRAADNAYQDLDIEITQATYNILLEYAQMDKLDLVMLLEITGEGSRYCLMSEDWLKNQNSTHRASLYVV